MAVLCDYPQHADACVPIGQAPGVGCRGDPGDPAGDKPNTTGSPPPPPPTLVRATVAASAGGGYPPCSNGLSVEDAGAGGGALAVDTRTLSEVSIDLSIDQSRIS